LRVATIITRTWGKDSSYIHAETGVRPLKLPLTQRISLRAGSLLSTRPVDGPAPPHTQLRSPRCRLRGFLRCSSRQATSPAPSSPAAVQREIFCVILVSSSSHPSEILFLFAYVFSTNRIVNFNNVLTHVLHRPVESAANNGRSAYTKSASEGTAGRSSIPARRS